MSDKIQKINIQPIFFDEIKSSNHTFNGQIFNNFSKKDSFQSEIVDFEDYFSQKNISSNSTNNSNKIKQTNNDTSNDDNSSVFNNIMNSTATFFVTESKIMAGVADIAEHINDGLIWAGGKVVEGTTFAIAQGVGLFDESTKKDILNWRENAKDWTKETIAINAVDDIENSIFNTQLGSKINDMSYMKYDSNTANKIENITKVGTEISAATTATIATGGVASPTLISVIGGLGFTEGTGEQAEKTYQKNRNTTGAQEAGIMFSGLEGATRWYAYGRLGASATRTVSQVGNILIQNQYTVRFGTSSTFREALQKVLSTRRHRAAGEYLRRSATGAVTTFTDLVDMSNGVFGTLADSLNDGNMSTKETGARIAVGLAQNAIFNTGFNRLDFFGNSLRTPEFINSRDKRVISLIKELIVTGDAIEDSGAIPLDFYEVGKNIVNSVKERNN